MKFEALRLPDRSRKLTVIFFLLSALLIAGVFSLRLFSSRGLKRELGHFAKSGDTLKSDSTDTTHDKTLRRLCEEGSQTAESSFDDSDLENNNPKAWKQVDAGMKRAEKLLPLTKRLVIDSLKAMPESFNLSADQLAQAQKNIQAVNTVVLDKEISDSAEVRDEDPNRIHIGAGYAIFLTSDEETVLLLGHELTHVADFDGNLRSFIHTVAKIAEDNADVHPTRSQRPDLTCDFIGEQATKRFIRMHPTKETVAMRFSHALDYNCGYNTDDSDDEHLSQDDTLRALLVLDSELSNLILNQNR